MPTVGVIDLLLRANTNAFARGLKSASTSVGSFVSDTHTHLATLGGAFAAVAAAGGVAALTHGALQAIDATGDLAQRIGTTTSNLVELRYATQLTGSETEVLDGALQKLNANLGDAAQQGGPAAKTLERMGLDARELVQLDPAVAFKRIAAGFSTLPNQAAKAAAAMDIFGRSGVGLLNTLSAAPGELDRLAAEARALGISFSDIDAAQVGAANDALDRMGYVLQGVVNQFAIKLAPVVVSAGESLIEFAKGGEQAGYNVETGFERMLRAADAVSESVHAVRVAFVGAQAVIYGSMVPAVRIVGTLYDAVTHLREGITSLAGSKIDTTEKLGQAIGSDFSKLTGQKYSELKNEFNASAVSVSGAYAQITSGAGSATAAIQESGRAAREAGESFTKMVEGVTSLQGKLQLQISTFGMDANAIEIYKLAQLGANDATLSSLEALADQVKALEANKKAQEDATKAKERTRQEQIQRDLGIIEKASQYTKATFSPLENFQETLKELRSLRTQGLIGDRTFDTQKLAAFNTLQEQLQVNQKPRFAGALEAGSAEARSAILSFRAQGQVDPAKDILAAQRAQLAAQQEQVRVLGRIENKLAPNSGLIDPDTQLSDILANGVH